MIITAPGARILLARALRLLLLLGLAALVLAPDVALLVLAVPGQPSWLARDEAGSGEGPELTWIP